MNGLVKLVLKGCLLCSGVAAFAQTPADNLQKYWIYRERLKNFVVVGNCAGCNIPAQYRESGTGNTNGIMEWSDATQSLGLYIGILATEYRLLKEHHENTTRTVEELYYALETINRLDVKAEYYWDSLMNGNSRTGELSYPYRQPNGFFIRDDVDTGFLKQHQSGTTIWQHLNSAALKLPDSNCMPRVLSGFSAGIYDEKQGPREESIDQVIVLLQGLALTVRCVDSMQDYQGKAFYDGKIQLVKEARAIANRIVNHIRLSNWTIKNPVMAGCVQGISGNRSCKIGAPGGCDARFLAIGVAMSNQYIQEGYTSFSTARKNARGWFSNFVFRRGLKHIPIGKQDFKVLTLAAIGNVWGNATQPTLAMRTQGPKRYYEHIPLLHQVLYNSSNTIPDSLYKSLLNTAPMAGASAHSNCDRWNNYYGGGCAIYGPSTEGKYPRVELPGLDYMLYFNLFVISHPDYLPTYRPFRIEELVEAVKPLSNNRP